MLRYGVIDEGDTQVLICETSAAIFIEKRLGTESVVTLDYAAKNLRILAEHFSDQIGYGNAVALLKGWEVPPCSPLWTLNHKGGTNYFTDR